MYGRGLRDTRGGERGSVLMLALVFSIVAAIAVSLSVMYAMHEAKTANFALDQTQALALAEGVTESAQKHLLDSIANFVAPELVGTIDISGVSYDYTITSVGAPINRTDPDGVILAIQPYEIESAVDVESGGARVSRVVDLTMTPIFQYMIFYNSDLEILPGPSMTLGGRVHANGDIYVGCGNTLTVDTEYFRATGDMFRQRKNDGSTTGGTVNIRVTGSAAYQNMTNTMDSSNTNWTSLALSTWNGTVQSGDHGITEVSVPSIGTMQAYDADGNPGYYHSEAGLVIRDGAAYDTFDNPITLPVGTIVEDTFYDGRAGKNVTVTEINMGLLNSSGAFPANGLIYAVRSDATTSQPNGIRLTNAAELNAPLTVVTQNPLYIQGNYNTINKKGAAVIADAVNLLSNAWNDTKTAGSLPNASNTTYNLAMVTGDVATPDGGGDYSGGFENLPRFHENWSNRTATIRGSFVKIFDSQIATDEWRYGGDVYTAPIRNWSFETAFLDFENMPPLTPSAVYTRRVVWDDQVPLSFNATP